MEGSGALSLPRRRRHVRVAAHHVPDDIVGDVTFRRRVWAIGALVLLTLVAIRLIMAHMSADRREQTIAADLDRLATSVSWPHREYLAPRVAPAQTIIALLSSEHPPDPAMARNIAAAALNPDLLPGIALFAYRDAAGHGSWTLQSDDPGADLTAVEQSLDESFWENPGQLPALAADLGTWGRTLMLRFPLTGRRAGDSILEAIRLDPLYAELFLPEVRASFALQIYDETGLVWGKPGEPPDDARAATRSFPVAGQRWTVRAWPHPAWLAAERGKEWWAIVRVGLPTAPLVAAMLVCILLGWGRLAQRILRANQRTRLIVERALDAVITIDADGLITGWNPQAETIFGWPAKDAIGRSLASTVIPPEQREAYAHGLTRFLATGDGPVLNRRIEMAAWHRDGRKFPVEISLSPIRLGDTYTFTAFVRDITDRKRAEEELRRAKESAEAANRAKSEFLATMSHEIRTPMNGIFGMTELAMDTTNDAERRDFLVRARACAESLMTIINDVLDFSKMEAGKLDIERIEFDLRSVVDGVLDTLAIEATHKQLELVAFIDETLPARLQGDPGRLRQVLMNLAGNALKFTDHGEIVVRFERTDGGGKAVGPADSVDGAAEADGHAGGKTADGHIVTVRCSVRDTGIGIPRDKQRAIFESFTQVDNSTTRRYGGTGLGLAISQRLVSLMGGSIGVESEAGAGSTFWFTVPFEAATPARTTDVKPVVAGLRVLVVDDNATNRMVLLRTFQGWGCRPSLASGGAEAFDLLAHAARSGEPLDLVILDMQMPDLDGVTTAQRIRAEPATRDVPIIALTSISRSVAERVADLGFVALVQKPIKQTQLLDAVVAAVASRAGRQESAGAIEPGRPLRILVVDDNEANRIVAETVLQRAGYEVHLATGGLEAIAAARRLAPDLVLMDVRMPDIDGLAATAAIRAGEGAVRHVPILALTATGSAGDRSRCLAAGMTGYVGKPLQRKELLEAVARALAEARQQQPALPAEHARPAAAMHATEVATDEDPLDPEILSAITARFLDDAVARCQTLRSAAASGQAKTVESIGHYIKGGAAQLEIHSVSGIAATLEALGRMGHLESAAGLIAILEHELASARQHADKSAAAVGSG